MNSIKFNFKKITRLLRHVWFVAFMATLGLASCEQEEYTINAPDDLQERIDSIAAAKAAEDTGDTTYLDLSITTVGETDFSSGWWTVFSDYFTVPAGELLHLEFENVSNCASSGNNYENWVLIVSNATADRDADEYAEYFALRSDAYGWNGTMSSENSDYTYNSALLSNDYPDTDGDGDVWNDFRNTMSDASVTINVDHSATGKVYITATAVGSDGISITETYNQPVSATDDIVAFLTTEESYLLIKKAYLIPSQVTAVIDYDPVLITVEGTPTALELGDENFWGDGIATVTYADGSYAEVDTADVSFTVPDLTTVGEKTVIVSYNKTAEGEVSDQIVATTYTIDVTLPVTSLEVTTLPTITTYYFYSSDPIQFNTTGLEVTATYSDGTSAVLDNELLEFGTVPASAGSQAVEISYTGASSTVTTTCPVTLVKGIGQVGATDFSSGWWTVFSDDYSVASGASKTLTMYCYSDNLYNYHSPSTILRKADNTEYAVVRMDSYGWGDGYGTATLDSNWDWDTFASNISGSKVVITVTNNGDNTADIEYDVTYATGETHYQKYTGITVDSSDLNCALVIEEAYVVIVD